MLGLEHLRWQATADDIKKGCTLIFPVLPTRDQSPTLTQTFFLISDRQAAKEHHPDKTGGKEDDTFKAIQKGAMRPPYSSTEQPLIDRLRFLQPGRFSATPRSARITTAKIPLMTLSPRRLRSRPTLIFTKYSALPLFATPSGRRRRKSRTWEMTTLHGTQLRTFTTFGLISSRGAISPTMTSMTPRTLSLVRSVDGWSGAIKRSDRRRSARSLRE